MPAPTVSSNPVVQDQYEAQVATTAALTLSLRRLWATTDPLAGDLAARRYREGVALLVNQFGSMSASVAQDFYREMRTQADVAGAPALPSVDLPPRSLVNADLDWAFRAQQQVDEDANRIQDRVEAALQKAVIDVGRAQTAAAAAGDNKALGFARVARPGACPFCLSLAFRRTNGRIGVYKSRGTAGQMNQYHNGCHCAVVPIFDADYELEPHLAQAEALYAKATVNSGRGESLNDFRRAVYAERGGRPVAPTTLRPTVAPLPGGNALKALLDRLAESGATAA